MVPVDEQDRLGCACLGGELCALVGDAEHAAAVLRAIEPYADQFIVTGWHGLCAGPVERPLGIAAGVLGHTGEAEAHLRGAIRRAREAGSALWATWAQADLAELLRDSGQTAAARVDAEAALPTARELGLGSVAERAAAVLERRS